MCPAPFAKIFLFSSRANHLLNLRYPVPREGALAIVTDVGTGSGGRRCAFDEGRVKRTAKSCGPDAPMAGVKSLRSSRFLGMTVTNKLWSHRGEHEISRQTIARGRPDASAEPVCSCAFSLSALHMRPRVQRAPGLPCALSFFGGERICKSSGAMRGENAKVCSVVIIREGG